MALRKRMLMAGLGEPGELVVLFDELEVFP